MVPKAEEASEREDLKDFYDNCLLQKSGELECLDWPIQQATPFTDYFNVTALYNGPEGCLTNFNNISMLTSAYQGALMFEHDPEVRPLILAAFSQEVALFDSPKSTQHLHNPWYSFAWVAAQGFGADGDELPCRMVEEGLCTLRQFPATQATPTIDNTVLYEHYCDSRLGASRATTCLRTGWDDTTGSLTRTCSCLQGGEGPWFLHRPS